MKQTYKGSCHCGAIKFQAAIDLAPPGHRSEPARPGIWWTTTLRCNCSYCTKTRYWKAFVPAPDFDWLAGQDSSNNYRFGERRIDHYFCKTCGVQTFARATMDALGGEFFCVNIACLDGVPDTVLAAAPINYEDGINDAWDRWPAQTRHL
jgi:hypothetical protein